MKYEVPVRAYMGIASSNVPKMRLTASFSLYSVIQQNTTLYTRNRMKITEYFMFRIPRKTAKNKSPFQTEFL